MTTKIGSCVVVALAMLGGCATTQVVPLDVPGIEKSEQARVEDLRPALEKEGETFSFLVTSDAYAIARVAERITTPSPIRLFQHRAHETLPPGPPVKVLHLVVYSNSQSELRRGAIGAGVGGIVGALVAGQTVSHIPGAVSALADRRTFESQAGAEYKRAVYSDEENAGRGSVLVVQYVPGRDEAATQAAAAAAAAATRLAGLPAGTRLVYGDFDVQTRAAQGESIFVVSDVGASRWVLNDGQIVSASDGTPEKGAMHGVLVFGAGPAQVARGGRWNGTFRVGGGFEDVPVQFTLLGKQPRAVAGRTFNTARLRVEGYASRAYGGGVGTAGGAAFEGEMPVDADTGVVLELNVNSRHPSYAVRRQLVRIVSN